MAREIRVNHENELGLMGLTYKQIKNKEKPIRFFEYFCLRGTATVEDMLLLVLYDIQNRFYIRYPLYINWVTFEKM